MLLLRSFNRFILLSLALLGLSVSSVNAALMSADSSFGVDTVTIDDAGLEWLDLTVTIGSSYTDVINLMDPGETYHGWRYATTAEVVGLFISAGATAPFDDGLQGTDEQWIADLLLDFWGTTSTPGSVVDPANEAITAAGNPFLNTSVTASLALNLPRPPGSDGTNDFAWAELRAIGRDVRDPNIGSALVKVVPIPAAVWLFGTALIGLIGFGKRKARIAA